MIVLNFLIVSCTPKKAFIVEATSTSRDQVGGDLVPPTLTFAESTKDSTLTTPISTPQANQPMPTMTAMRSTEPMTPTDTPGTPITMTPVKVEIPGEFNPNLALEQIYGTNWVNFTKYSIEEKRIGWEFSGQVYTVILENFPVYTKVLTYTHFRLTDQDYILLLTETSMNFAGPQGSTSSDWHHIIGAMLFANVEGVWRSEIVSKQLLTLREFDIVHDKGELVQIGTDHYGYMFTLTSKTYGFVWDSILLIGWNEEFNYLLDMVVGERTVPCDDKAEDHCWAYKSSIQFIEDTNIPYYEIEIITKGTQGYVSSDFIREINQTRRYIFDGQKYVLEHEYEASTP